MASSDSAMMACWPTLSSDSEVCEVICARR
jgi:hypothetical protein